jgi:hypothetical protein
MFLQLNLKADTESDEVKRFLALPKGDAGD